MQHCMGEQIKHSFSWDVCSVSFHVGEGELDRSIFIELGAHTGLVLMISRHSHFSIFFIEKKAVVLFLFSLFVFVLIVCGIVLS